MRSFICLAVFATTLYFIASDYLNPDYPLISKMLRIGMDWDWSYLPFRACAPYD